MPKSAIIVDCDPGWDDAMALAFALKSQRVVTLGVTTVFGNGPLNETTENARRITALCGRPKLVVHPGCDVPLSGSGADLSSCAPKSVTLEALPVGGAIGAQHAVDFIIEAAQENANELTIVAMGPLTNLATALMRDRTLASRISNVVIMGGALSFGNVTRYSEFNFFSDPDAARITLNADVRKVIVPLETCAQLPITAQFVTDLRRIGTEVASVLAEIAAERLFAGAPGDLVPLYDVLAVLFVFRPDIFQVDYGKLDIETGGPRRGALSFARSQLSSSGVATYVDASSGYSHLCEILSSEASDVAGILRSLQR